MELTKQIIKEVEYCIPENWRTAKLNRLLEEYHMKIDLSNTDPPPRIQAEFQSKCVVCGEWIEEGDWIVKDIDENWVHEGCADADS